MTTAPGQTAAVDRTWTVGQVARTFGISVRTLHHYDEQGLVVPSGRTASGYRLYDHGDLERLSTVVGYRRLGFALVDVRDLLEADGPGRLAHLRRQQAAVRARLAQTADLAEAIEHALEAEMQDRPATTEDLRAIFGDGYSEEYQAEAQERWGQTPQWEQSQARTARFTPADWVQIKKSTEAFEAELAQAVADGVDPASDEGVALADRHHASIEVYYDCSDEMHANLAELYVSDERFTRHYDERRPGLAQWLHDAILARVARHDGGHAG